MGLLLVLMVVLWRGLEVVVVVLSGWIAQRLILEGQFVEIEIPAVSAIQVCKH
jgi:hypothetical protein